MKCALLTLFALVLAAAVRAAGPDDGKLTLHVKNITVKELLLLIEKQTAYTFVYNNSDLDTDRKVTVDVESVPVEKVLAQALPEVTATVRANQIVLVRKTPISPPLPGLK